MKEKKEEEEEEEEKEEEEEEEKEKEKKKNSVFRPFQVGHLRIASGHSFILGQHI